ncbi:UNVERIFIED_CONTAM: hypothetical protein FKN15_043944 [Acipenser sinensis]
MKTLLVTVLACLITLCSGKTLDMTSSVNEKKLQETAREIAGYAEVALDIINLAVSGKAQNRSYNRLADFTDTIGNRLSGSPNLELAIKYMYKALTQDGLENVHLEPVKVPHWVRGEEYAMMLEPRNHSMAILGLGSSIGTPSAG